MHDGAKKTASIASAGTELNHFPESLLLTIGLIGPINLYGHN